MQKNELVINIGDMHEPFAHADAVPFVAAVKRKYGPTRAIFAGDEVDFHALGNYDHDPDGMSAGEELLAGMAAMRKWYKLFPNADVCESNHTARPFRMAYRMGLSKLFIRDYKDFLKAPEGWNWHQHLEVDGVRYEHGEGYSGQFGAIKSALQNMRSTCIGHIHSFAGINYAANPRFLIFGFNVGCLIDKDKYAFAYGRTFKFKPIIGVGLIERGSPRFIAMQMDGHGRWKGRL